jgi:hypothetical protein
MLPKLGSSLGILARFLFRQPLNPGGGKRSLLRRLGVPPDFLQGQMPGDCRDLVCRASSLRQTPRGRLPYTMRHALFPKSAPLRIEHVMPRHVFRGVDFNLIDHSPSLTIKCRSSRPSRSRDS